MDSSFAGLGAVRGWHWSGRFIAAACATMLIVAGGLVFRKRNRQTGALVSDAIALGGKVATAATAAAAADALDRVADMM